MVFDCYAQSDCVQQMEFYKPTLQARYTNWCFRYECITTTITNMLQPVQLQGYQKIIPDAEDILASHQRRIISASIIMYHCSSVCSSLALS